VTQGLDREKFAVGGAVLLALLALWEAAPAFGWIDPLFISSPTRVVAAAQELFSTGEIWPDIAASASEFAWGYLAAIAIGVPLGLVIGWYRRAQFIIGPFIDVMNAVPRITFLPLLVLWFGIGLWSKIAVVFLGAVIPIAIATSSGVAANEARFLRVARSFGASPQAAPCSASSSARSTPRRSVSAT
jgi:NitT/TauT family transport system permease protein